MPAPQTLDPLLLTVLLLFGTAVCWYIAVAALAAVQAERASTIIIAGAVPALAGVIWFAATGRSPAALGLALGLAMSSATLVLGIVACAEPAGRRIIEDPSRRLKATLLPAAVVLLVTGFNGSINPLHALLLAGAGAVVGWLGISQRREVPEAGLAHASEAPQQRAQEPGWARPAQIALAIVLAIVGAGMAAGAATAIGHKRGWSLDVEMAFWVSCVIALPLIGVGTRYAGDGIGPIAQRGLVLLAVGMLCVAVPATVVIEVLRQAVLSARGESGAGLTSLITNPPSVPMPLSLWRGDAVMLCVAGLLILPAALGRARLGRAEGVALILLYIAYLGVRVIFAR